MNGAEMTADQVLAGVDLSGKSVVVTGGSTGIGLETARAVAAAGASVAIAARTPQKVADALVAIGSQVPGARVEGGHLDLADLASVRRFAHQWSLEHRRLHVLVNNAGVMFTPFERTVDGFEMQLGTDHLGHFLLTILLLPALLAAAPARMVTLSSGGHKRAGIDWNDPNFHRRPYDKFVAYGQAKTANVLFSVELERRAGARGVHAYAVHPGMIPTELGRYMSPEDIEVLRRAGRRGPTGRLPSRKTIAQGAATSVWAATAPELERAGGTYLADCAISGDHAEWAVDHDGAQRLWRLSEELVGETSPI